MHRALAGDLDLVRLARRRSDQINGDVGLGSMLLKKSLVTTGES
jgi:hypothetical protein